PPPPPPPPINYSQLQGHYIKVVIKSSCLHHEIYNLYECPNRGWNPFWGIKSISKYWENPLDTQAVNWRAPPYLFWICGNRAYTQLPNDWTGICTVGIIKPAFFLLERNSEQHLGVPLYDQLRKGTRNLTLLSAA
uniref:ENR1 protein n=1 Tax=Ficedula albicollis TaxID=59894 RepID=A0A803WDV1_FICAL